MSDLGYFLPWEIEEGTKYEFLCKFFSFYKLNMKFF